MTYFPLGWDAATPSLTHIRDAADRILASYYGKSMSITQWRDADWLVMRWKENGSGKFQLSLPFRFESICCLLQERRQFVPAAFNFPALLSGWLDASVEMAPQFHIMNSEAPGEAITIQVPSAISEKFPVVPQLDREGRAFSSLQLPLLQSFLELRVRLVETSADLFQSNDWLRDLFSYLSTSVALVDNTLHQLYYRAQFESERHGWSFDAKRLGPTHGQRIRKKLAWVGLITGNPLDTCPREVERFINLKNVRNHIAHFDPPVLAFTIEDVASWLNCARDVAIVLAEIRRLAKEPLCLPLVEILLAPNVVHVPANPGQRRLPQPPNIGYASSCSTPDTEWPTQTQEATDAHFVARAVVALKRWILGAVKRVARSFPS
jgi:hypothetical protein